MARPARFQGTAAGPSRANGRGDRGGVPGPTQRGGGGTVGTDAAHHGTPATRTAQNRSPRPPRTKGTRRGATRHRTARRSDRGHSNDGDPAMKWATRRGCHVDRAACAWLLRRFIDSDAEFFYVDELADVPTDATPFDMRGADLSHHRGDCTFETMLRRYRLDDPVLWDVAGLVHEADLADERYDEPSAAGLDAICRGLTLVLDDERTLEVSAIIFDGLY